MVALEKRYWGRPRQYAVACPVRAARVAEANRQSARKTYARERELRRCQCGCRRLLPPRVWYHPDCAEEVKAGRRGERAREPGKRCSCCFGLPWRRHPVIGCGRCGAPYAPEKPSTRPAELGSVLSLIE